MEDLTPQTVAVLRVLLRKFRSLRELWDAQHKHYGDLNRVEAGYANLLKILLITEPNANTTSVFSKIHGFINAFAKEYSENKRRTRGNCSWYVEELQFLVDAKLVCNDDSVTADLSWLQKPPGMSSNFVDDLSTANISCLESSENLNCIIVTEQNTGPMEDTLRMEVDIKLEEDTPSIDPFLLDPLEDNVVVSSGNESQDSFQSAISIPIHPFQSDPLADVPTTDPLTSNISNAPIIISRTSPPPLVPRVCPALPINLPPLAFFKPADTRQVSPQPSPKAIVKATESAQQTKRSSIFAMHIATKLQGLGLQQRSIVKDMINEVIFEAELGHLRMDHVTDIHEALRESLPVAPS
uniref:MADF domain-containing protein n=1 Tax=Anopheles atroparvus TaxID=41427 RepID=A0AAG5DPA0_ANOAO